MEIVKIYPTSEELSTIETSLRCKIDGCTAMFKCKSNLHLHLAKHHGNKEIEQTLKKSDRQKNYYCPCQTCVYNSKKSFKSMKYLKQHYLKVHLDKKHICTKCSQKYSTESLKKSHEEYCGLTFKCPECPAKYTCYDTLTTHARRKQHKIFPKIKYKDLFNGNANACSRIICIVQTEIKPKQQLLLPKNLLTAGNNQKTNEIPDSIHENTPKSKGIKRKRNQTEMQTQTVQNIKLKAIKSTAGTQTEVVSLRVPSTTTSSASTSTSTSTSCNTDYLGLNNHQLVSSSNKKSIKTQTTSVSSSSRACNTSFDINQIVEKNTLGTQTLSPHILANANMNMSKFIADSTNNASTSTNTSPTHIDQSIGTDDLLQSYINDIHSTTFCNSDMETQTDWLTNMDLLSNSSNYTQTCDDILPPDLRFNNTHTQTVLDDILRSVGSQTNMRVNGGGFTNNETQTDSIFEELLQEINS